MNISLPLPLKGSHNTRDLGGYPTKDGRVTASHRYLRSDSLLRLTKGDWNTLWEYGVRCVVDLRASKEAEEGGYLIPSGIEYQNFPLLDHIHSDLLAGTSLPSSMEQMYRDLLDGSGKTFVRIFEKMAEYTGECVLFHCTAGKDRTGLVSMLLLSLAGVREEWIIKDYSATQEYMLEPGRRQQELLQNVGVHLPKYIFEAAPHTMEQTLIHLKQVYGGAGEYLLRAGLAQETLAKIVPFLTQDA